MKLKVLGGLGPVRVAKIWIDIPTNFQFTILDMNLEQFGFWNLSYFKFGRKFPIDLKFIISDTILEEFGIWKFFLRQIWDLFLI